jgi:hypothetical protein
MNSHEFRSRPDDMEIRLRQWMSSTAPDRPPEALMSGMSARTRHIRQRPAILSRTWLGDRKLPSSSMAVPVLLGLLIALLLIAAAVVGTRLLLDRRTSIEPSALLATATQSPSARVSATSSVVPGVTVTSPPPATPAVSPPATLGPSPASTAAAQPCPAMLQLLSTYITDARAPIPGGPPIRTNGLGDILMTTLGTNGAAQIGRFDPSSGALVPVESGVDRAFPSGTGVPVPATGRFFPSPDGRALAFEEGDLRQAGCGDPLVALNDGGRLRPFPAGAFQQVRHLAWAPDGSALFGVSRPTLDPSGVPYFDQDMGTMIDGPGMVLRWDTATANVTELGSPCDGCPLAQLYVSPDGRYVATDTGKGEVAIVDREGRWRTVSAGSELVGWSDATSLVLNDGEHGLTGLDGSTRPWAAPCCHGTGFGGPLSPDGSTIAGVTMGSDFVSRSVTLLNVRDGTARTVWTVADVRGCDGFTPGSSGHPDCIAAHPETPGPDAISGYARIFAWSPDGNRILLLDQNIDTPEATLQIVLVDGSGAGPKVNVSVPDLSMTLGFPNIGPAVVWLPGSK